VVRTAPLTPRYEAVPYWWGDAELLQPAPSPLPGTADVVVVGGGYTGLAAALEELASCLSATSGVRCVCHADKGLSIANSIKATHLYHIAQEACTNALKHAKARNVEIRLRPLLGEAFLSPRGRGRVVLEIQDDGRGIPKDTPEGLGLRIMRHRARVIRARLTIEPVKPRGTVVSCIFQERSHVRDQAS